MKTELLKKLQTRFWVFHSLRYEESSGLRDFVDSRSTKEAAFKIASEGAECARVFDSHTGKSWFFDNTSNLYYDTPAKPSEDQENPCLLEK